MMYDHKTKGKEVEAKDKAVHDKYTKMGYTHDSLEMKEHENIVDTITDVLSEDGHSQNPTGDGTDLSLNDVKNIDVIRQLNAHVGMISQREYLNPKGALLQLQDGLQQIGLTFDILQCQKIVELRRMSNTICSVSLVSVNNFPIDPT